MYSFEHKIYLKNIRKKKFIINFSKIFIIIFLLSIWEYLGKNNLINTFLTSYPSKIGNTIIDLFKNYNLLDHIFITSYETIISFILSSFIGLFIASILWWSNTLSKILEPYITILNSLPKVALGPLLIIWVGANIKSIILMAILISIFTIILNMYNAFIETDKSKIFLMKSFKANKFQIFTKLVFRSNIPSFANTLKINISLSLIGVIMGELLVSKKGLGYLINYGSDIFNLNLVITSIFILGIISYSFYFIVNRLTKNIS